MSFHDLTGKTFGRLTVIERATNHAYSSGRQESKWLCRCECGNQIITFGCNLTSGNTNSCGCYQREKNGDVHRTHGESKTRLYKIWDGMKDRCYREKNLSFERYGGRGIRVCDEWKNDYAAFRDWALTNGYDKDAPYGECTLDRIDMNGNYCPENCRWVNLKGQANNKRNNHYIECFGKIMTLSEWCEATGLSKSTLETRLNKRNWTIERALLTPKRKRKLSPDDVRFIRKSHIPKDKQFGAASLARKYGVDPGLISLVLSREIYGDVV